MTANGRSGGFEECGAALVYGLEIGGHNPRSRRAFEKCGYTLVQEIPQPPGAKAAVAYDLALTREAYRRKVSGR